MDITSLRKPKILGMAIFDWTVSLFLAVIVGLFLSLKGIGTWIAFLVAWTLFGVYVHYIFGIDTMLGYYLNLNERPVRP